QRSVNRGPASSSALPWSSGNESWESLSSGNADLRGASRSEGRQGACSRTAAAGRGLLSDQHRLLVLRRRLEVGPRERAERGDEYPEGATDTGQQEDRDGNDEGHHGRTPLTAGRTSSWPTSFEPRAVPLRTPVLKDLCRRGRWAPSRHPSARRTCGRWVRSSGSCGR